MESSEQPGPNETPSAGAPQVEWDKLWHSPGAAAASSPPPAYGPPRSALSQADALLSGRGGPGRQPQQPGFLDKLRKFGPAGAALVYMLTKLKFLLVGFKILPFLKVMLLTGGTMLVSIWFYALAFGWKFAVGFVLCILVHELGHVVTARYFGVPASAPMFIPGFGALILTKMSARSAWQDAMIGIGGPVAGTLAGLACLALYGVTQNRLFLGLAFTAFLMNLFNLTPMFPLDGGWIVGAIHPRLWLVGLALLVTMYVSGFARNPLLIVLIVMSIPRLWAGLRKGDLTPEGGTPVTTPQRWTMGFSYVGLCALLMWLMMVSHVPV